MRSRKCQTLQKSSPCVNAVSATRMILSPLRLKTNTPGIGAAIPAIPHIFRKIRALVRDHGELPAATGGEAVLPLGRVRRRHHEGGAIAQMLEDSIEAVGPHRAVRAASAHIVNDEQR